jgi:hypothetical protein
VNRDASLFSRAPGSDLVARHGSVAPPTDSGNADRRTEASAAEPAGHNPRHNKSGRGRSSCRSPPASDTPRRRTAGLMLPRHETPKVDERHDCQDIGSAYVPGTVWGTASSQTAKFRSRRRACLLIPANYYAPPGPDVSPLPIGRPATSAQHRQHVCEPSARHGQRSQKRPGWHAAPDRRGFRQPTTPGNRT